MFSRAQLISKLYSNTQSFVFYIAIKVLQIGGNLDSHREFLKEMIFLFVVFYSAYFCPAMKLILSKVLGRSVPFFLFSFYNQVYIKHLKMFLSQ